MPEVDGNGQVERARINGVQPAIMYWGPAPEEGIPHMRRLAWLVTVTLLVSLSCGGDEAADDSRALEERLEKLRSVPYTATTDEEVPADLTGVTVFERDRAWPGYNLYCSRIEPEALLLDMEGDVVNRWFYEQDRFKFWNYAILLDGGELVVLNKFWYIFKLDWDSNLIWERQRPVHHDVAVADDGTLYVIQLETKRHRDLTVRFPRIAHLTADGEEIDSWSSYDRLDHLKEVMDTAPFLDSVLDSMLACGISPDTVATVDGRIDKSRISKGTELFDYFRLNTITILPDTPLGRRDPRFAPGHLLICLRNVNQIAVLDWASGNILWSWGQGDLEWPHHPTMLENGNILIFDNGVLQERSRVIELNPLTLEIEWEYVGSPPGSFYSRIRGSSQRLPNGNTLICESNEGRAFEITRDGEMVWEWYNPIMKDGRRVQVYRMLRYPPDMVEQRLDRRSPVDGR